MLVRSYFSQKKSASEVKSEQKVVVNPEKVEINGKKVVGLSPGKEKEEIQKLKVSNLPSPQWQPALEKTLRAQGGDSLKEVSFNKVDSFVWAHDGIALFVESVIVTIKNDKNAVTTFRVLVDAQSGKILQNWDHPIFDPLNPKDRFRIKIDPRYHSE
jgi:Zn-dependent metalloprotease